MLSGTLEVEAGAESYRGVTEVSARGAQAVVGTAGQGQGDVRENQGS